MLILAFSDIVNGLLFDGRPVVDPDPLSDVMLYSVYKADGKIHEHERDVSKILKTAGFTAISGSSPTLLRTSGPTRIMCPPIKPRLFIAASSEERKELYKKYGIA